MKKEQKILQGKKAVVFLNNHKDKNLQRLLTYWGAEGLMEAIIDYYLTADRGKLS